jgi:hypothetical protein
VEEMYVLFLFLELMDINPKKKPNSMLLNTLWDDSAADWCPHFDDAPLSSKDPLPTPD